MNSNRHAKRFQLSQRVASYLREQIVSGGLANGTFLRVDAIAKALGVSTTPVREGLLLLRSESFVQLIPRRGFVVNSFSKEDLSDLFWVQATVGAELAARAAMNMSQGGFARLQKLHLDCEMAIASGDETRVGRAGHEFHRAINLAAQSSRLALLMGNLVRQLPSRHGTRTERQLRQALEYHPIILDAIRIRDKEAARSLMYRHMMSLAEDYTSSRIAGNTPQADRSPNLAPR